MLFCNSEWPSQLKHVRRLTVVIVFSHYWDRSPKGVFESLQRPYDMTFYERSQDYSMFDGVDPTFLNNTLSRYNLLKECKIQYCLSGTATCNRDYIDNDNLTTKFENFLRPHMLQMNKWASAGIKIEASFHMLINAWEIGYSMPLHTEPASNEERDFLRAGNKVLSEKATKASKRNWALKHIVT